MGANAFVRFIFYSKYSNIECNRFVSASKDGTVRIWNATLRKVIMVFSLHTAPVMCVKWGGIKYF